MQYLNFHPKRIEGRNKVAVYNLYMNLKRIKRIEEKIKTRILEIGTKTPKITGDQKEPSRILRRAGIIGTEVYSANRPTRLMDIAKRLIEYKHSEGGSIASGTILFADALSRAKGRMGRSWWAPKGGLYLCVVLAPVLLEARWHLYSLALGVGVATALREMGFGATLRWVNDVLIQEKKVAGILTEVYRPEPGADYLLIGLGINININAFPSYLSSSATSLNILAGRKIDEEKVLCETLAFTGIFFGALEEWESLILDSADLMYEDPSDRLFPNPVVKVWRSLSATLGKWVIYGLDADNSPELTGQAIDMEEDGGLILLTSEGERIKVISGEVRHLSTHSSRPFSEDMPR